METLGLVLIASGIAMLFLSLAIEVWSMCREIKKDDALAHYHRNYHGQQD